MSFAAGFQEAGSLLGASLSSQMHSSVPGLCWLSVHSTAEITGVFLPASGAAVGRFSSARQLGFCHPNVDELLLRTRLLLPKQEKGAEGTIPERGRQLQLLLEEAGARSERWKNEKCQYLFL